MVQLRIKPNKWLETAVRQLPSWTFHVFSTKGQHTRAELTQSSFNFIMTPRMLFICYIGNNGPFLSPREQQWHQNASHAIQRKSLQWICSDLYLVVLSLMQQYVQGFRGYPPCSELHNYFVYSLFLLAGNIWLRWGTPALSQSLKPRRSSQGRRCLLPSAGELELGTKGASQAGFY